jgi:hypothetical protein
MKWTLSNTRAGQRASMLAAVCMGLALGACTTLGTGTGETSPGNSPVSFDWRSTDGGVTGTMTASFPGGATFTGPYLEVTNTALSTSFDPMWAGWRTGWTDWDYGFGGPWAFDGTTTTYSGKVVANLQGSSSQRMRCNFDLNDPPSGMDGGGQGKCQIAGGATIDAVFPHGTSRTTRNY